MAFTHNLTHLLTCLLTCFDVDIDIIIHKMSEAEQGWFGCVMNEDIAPLKLNERIELNRLRRQFRRVDSGDRTRESRYLLTNPRLFTY